MSAALKAIADFADRICGTISPSGQSTSLKFTGDIKAELSRLAKQLADLGVSGSGVITSNTYEGVLQNELTTALKDQRDCKVTISKSLLDTLPAVRGEWRGWLQPANEPTPLNACGQWLKPPEGAILGLVADNVFVASRMGRITPFRLFDCAPLVIERGPNGIKIDAPIYDKAGNRLGQVVDSGYKIPKENELIVEHSGDLSALVVHNDPGEELLYIHYLNPQVVRIRGNFLCPSHPKVIVTITNQEIYPFVGTHRNCFVSVTGFQLND
jgi:hypothetical protein